MNGYKRRTAAKKSAIIEAARELFSKRGIQNVSVSEIARLAGVSQVSIYNYFGGKDSLASEALISIVNSATDSLDRLLEQDIPFSDKLNFILQIKSNVVDQITISHFNEKALGDKAFRHVFQTAVKEKAMLVYEKFVELGKKEGAIDPLIPTEAAVSYLAASISVFQNSDYLAASTEYKMGMIKLFLYGIIGK